MNTRFTIEGQAEGVVLSIPMRFQHRRGRKHIVVPEGLSPEASIPAQPQEAVLVALARAHVWKEGLESGRFRSVQDIADTLGVDGSYVGRILQLTLLPPWEQERLLILAAKSPERSLQVLVGIRNPFWS